MYYPSQVEQRNITVLFADLRGFTALSETHPTDQVMEVLNTYLSTMSDVAIDHGGTVDKFIGDAIMVLFGVPTVHEDDAQRAVACAAEMQIAMDIVNQHAKTYQFPELYMGIGINSGWVMSGILGSDRYSEHTVIGDEVNIAARIEAYSMRGQVLLSQNTVNRIGAWAHVSDRSEVYVKGKKDLVALYDLQGIPSLDLVVPRREIRKSPRVEVDIPVEFNVPNDNGDGFNTVKGMVHDLGYNGMLVELDTKLEEHTEMGLNVNFSLNGFQSSEVGVKVVGMRERSGRVFCNVEFTSMSGSSQTDITRFLQRLIQGVKFS